MDVGQALPRFGGFPHSKRRPARRRDVGSPKSTGGSTHDLTGVFVKPSKGDHAFFMPARQHFLLQASPVRRYANDEIYLTNNITNLLTTHEWTY